MSKTYVLTLVASDIPLTESVLGATEITMAEQRINEIREPVWLSKDKAIDFFIDSMPNPHAINEIRNTLKSVRVDFFIQPEEDRKKKLLIADMDSTIVIEETLDEVAWELGLKPLVAAITRKSMLGELNFETSLRKRVALLAGKPASVLEKVRDKTQLSEGAKTLVKTMRRHGATCVLVSGGFTYFTSYVAKLCDFNNHHSNNLQIRNGKITGFVEDPVLDKSAKLSFMNEYMAQKRLRPEQVIAIGDGANDKEIVKEAGLGIGYYPKPVLEELTHNVINYGDLTAALYAQGYKEKEFRDY